MMAGLCGRKSQQQLAYAPIQEDCCGKCLKSIDNEPLVACSECHQEFHKTCLTRMANSRPIKEWKCMKCLVNDVHEADFFFTDNDQQQTLRAFHQKADEFKTRHFNINNPKVSKFDF
jgi:succinate dehydrogenase/fumarate reductase-like Fe-S protein